MSEPYYSDDHVTIYHGDCLDVLPSLTDVDLVMTSPPYNLSEGGRRSSGKDWRRLHDGYEDYDDDMPHDIYVEWQRDVLRACWASLTPTGAIYYQHKPIMRDGVCRLPTEQIPPEAILRQIVTWDRRVGFTQSYWYYTPRYEWVLILAPLEHRIVNLGVFDVWEIAPNPDPNHPASYPLELPEKAILNTSPRLVCDPFTGSGTTLLAAKRAGVKAIGIEKSERYCELAAERCGGPMRPVADGFDWGAA